MKVITVCGSLTFKEEIIHVASQMELRGNVLLIPIFPVNNDKVVFTEEELIMLGKMHKEKIKLSDAILVVNVNSYIGNSTKDEIEFAKSLNKEIIYYTDLIETSSI
ncbi:hypothetical protein [Candidatus Enterococcus mansonii]|uniref:DUF4406 domain-containing protein n=1 Tax=Candidatus Enterococcus mansonii TaxID=1834181 RepID=A0A242CIC9_9ENTE|nr:hypothetical protein [Enterococcus sp. 4G2_DIV0659]OTO09888.1 hypothetical protein A5880_000571 [Enterococcus sp. 4G2_DIV0659]